MKFYTFGDKKNPVILLLPGTCCHWKNNFGPVIPLLQDEFYVVCVSYDGFDETEKSEFPDMLTETVKIEQYIKREFCGKIHTAYGCSLGGSFVGLLAKRRKIHIEHGILGSSDLDETNRLVASLQTRVMLNILMKILHTGTVSDKLKRTLQKKAGEEYTRQALKMFGKNGVDMSFVTKNSVKNQIKSDLVTKLGNQINVPNTTIHCFYAKKMGEKYLKRYQQHFKNPHIVTHNLMHEELLICRPEEWTKTVKDCVK